MADRQDVVDYMVYRLKPLADPCVTQNLRSHYVAPNISETEQDRDSYSARLIWTYTRRTQGFHFE